MPRTERLAERIGAVFLPEADTVEVVEDLTPSLERPPPLKQGCYTVSLRAAEARSYSSSHSGTLRMEHVSRGVRFSGDLYRNQPIEDLVTEPLRVVGALRPPSDEAADTGGIIPIYPRTSAAPR